MNIFGHNFRLAIWGESHGPQIGISIDGVPAGIPLSAEDFEADLARRRSGARGTTPRREPDIPQIVSGLYNGMTTGAPLTIEFANTDTHSQDYATVARHYRPSHADLVAYHRFNGFNDPRGGGHFSARLTVAFVAAGVVAKKDAPAGHRLRHAHHRDRRMHRPRALRRGAARGGGRPGFGRRNHRMPAYRASRWDWDNPSSIRPKA